MTVRELLLKNRSYRGYDEAYRFTKAQLENYVECTRYTASSVNKQPFCYYLACEEEQCQKIQPLTGWARALPKMQLPHPGKRPTAFIVICQNTTLAPDIARFQKDVGIVAEAILLCAVEEGLGGCMIGNFSPEAVSEALQLPQNNRPVLIIALGKPAEEIVLCQVQDGNTDYYRDENDCHYVPKRALAELLINPEE